MDFTLPPDAAAVRDAARRFTADVLLPLDADLAPAEGGLPAAVRARCEAARRAAGLWGLTVPPSAGGRGLPWLALALAHAEAHRSLAGMWPHGLMAAGEPPTPLLAAQGPQRERFLLPCLDGRRQAHQIVAGAGLRVRRHGGGVSVDGAVPSVPAFAAEDLLLVAATDGGGPVLILEPGVPGYRVGPSRPTMGSVELVDLTWDGCQLDAERVLAGGRAAALRWQALQRAVVLGAGALGAAERCLEAALAHVRTRRTFGQPLADRQAIQWMLADGARDVHAARLLVYEAATLADLGEDPSQAAARAKVFATEAACRVVDRVIQMHGGYGYSRDLPFERYWRDLRYYRFAEGGNEDLLAQDGAALARGWIVGPGPAHPGHPGHGA